MGISRSLRIWLIAVGFVTIDAMGGYVAVALAQEPVPVKREILALYDGAQEGDADLTRIHRFAELPLNHLGYVLRFHDIRKKLPDPAEMARYRGVLTWFVGSVAGSNTYLVWASQVSRFPLRYVILGDIGIPVSTANIPTINRLLQAAGVHHTGDHIAPALGTRIVRKDPRLTEFECKLGPVLPDYPVIGASGSGTRTGLIVETPALDGKRSAVLVAIGKEGAYAALNYEFCHGRPPLYQGRWLIDPFVFFHAAFGSGDQPIPDTTTASGNRLYLSVLGDEGWNRSSKIEGFRDTPATAGEVLLRELIEPFQDLPTTIALRDEESGESQRRGRQKHQIVQRLLGSPNIDLLRRRMPAPLSRFDSEYPSVSNLSPLASAGSDRLVNQPTSDDTAYANMGPVGENGILALRETITNTNAPLRLKPFSLNYHAHAGEYPALLGSIKDRLREARLAALTPVSANRYAAIVDGFSSTRIDRIGSAAWRISNRGGLQTVRFDAADGREVDVLSSAGVIGQKRYGTTLYVALDEMVESAVVSLTPLASGRAVSGSLALVESRWLVRHVVKDECGLSFEAQGYGDGSFTWSGASSDRYMITVDRAGEEVWRQTAEPDRAGNLRFVLAVGAIVPVTVRMKCTGVAHFARQ